MGGGETRRSFSLRRPKHCRLLREECSNSSLGKNKLHCKICCACDKYSVGCNMWFYSHRSQVLCRLPGLVGESSALGVKITQSHQHPSQNLPVAGGLDWFPQPCTRSMLGRGISKHAETVSLGLVEVFLGL